MANGEIPNNAADAKQVEAERTVDRRDARAKLRAWTVVLNTPEGRLLLWELLEHCSVFASIWDSSSKIHANAGRQDVGHYVMARIGEADETKLFLMMTEASDAKRALKNDRQALRQQVKREAEDE